MRALVKPLLLLVVVLLVPIVPFVIFGDWLEGRVTVWFSHPPPPAWLALSVTGVLATDVFLPVPSSFVSTLAGAKLGWALGTLASWSGLTLGAIFGFALARRFGPPLAEKFATPADLTQMATLTARYGPLILVLARAVPVLAEASVLLFGATQLPWRRFLPPLLASNLGIALAYSAFGQAAEQTGLLPLALAVSLALPVLLLMLVRKAESGAAARGWRQRL